LAVFHHKVLQRSFDKAGSSAHLDACSDSLEIDIAKDGIRAPKNRDEEKILPATGFLL